MNELYYLFVNPSACSGMGQKTYQEAIAYFEKLRQPYEVIFTKRNQSTRSDFDAILAKEERPLIPIIVIGGDGTLNQCINGIQNPDRFELSLLPAGSGNDFSRDKNLPDTVCEILSSILNRTHTRALDIVTAELSLRDSDVLCRDFLVSCGLGYDAEVCLAVNSSRLKPALNRLHLGKLVYLFFGLKNLISTKLVTMELTVNGTTTIYPRVFFLSSMNQPYEGGGIPMAPQAKDNDGMLSFFIAYNMSHWKALRTIPVLSAGKHLGRPGIALLNGTELTVTSSVPKSVHCDGEWLGYFDSCHVSIKKKIKYVY